jgi:phenylacetate-coenzyme A ligase PaaK-like adenylate-forming protein
VTGALTAAGLLDQMRDRVPQLRYDADEWTRRMMRWHFSSETGSPFWLSRRDTLSFDPLVDITCYADLRRFGLFDKQHLRGIPVRDLLPRGFAGRPFRVMETGGTTGAPCRVVDVTRAAYDIEMYRVTLRARGLDGLDALAMTPSGPHAYGHFVARLADTWAGAVHFIDFDPRWVKREIAVSGSADAYVRHLVAQTTTLLAVERPGLLFTTSKLLLALVSELPAPLSSYGIRGVCTGGTSCTPEERRYVQAEHLAGVQWIDTYGNTLMGHALQGDGAQAGQHSYHLPPPFAFLHVVDPQEPWRDMGIGERGRVRITTLLEDLFIPNLLERDSATAVCPHPWFPWDGVADVRPYDADDAEDATEGVY